MNALRIIGNNINQIAKKANEINNIYADDIEKLRKENYLLCHTLNQFLPDMGAFICAGHYLAALLRKAKSIRSD